jgi:hypothetical protein
MKTWITPAVVKNLYASLYCCHPFTKWKMPLPEQIKFVISEDDSIMASYLYDTGEDYEHTITISSARNAFYMTLVASLCHEMIHCSFHRQKGDKWRQHGKAFRDRCTLVGKLGLDHLEL